MTGAAFTRGECPSVFTQCSKCETVFKLSAEVLRAAGGQVRCGKCGEGFNALARLAEDSSAFETGESPPRFKARGTRTPAHAASARHAASMPKTPRRTQPIARWSSRCPPENWIEFLSNRKSR